MFRLIRSVSPPRLMFLNKNVLPDTSRGVSTFTRLWRRNCTRRSAPRRSSMCVSSISASQSQPPSPSTTVLPLQYFLNLLLIYNSLLKLFHSQELVSYSGVSVTVILTISTIREFFRSHQHILTVKQIRSNLGSTKTLSTLYKNQATLS